MMIWNPWKEIKRLRNKLDVEARWFEASERHNTDLREEVHRLMDRSNKLNIALQNIIAEEKPTSNATVKRIVRIAREGLKR
jgi:adenylosuccinate lyase